jgi:hypothetical protein
VGRLGILSRGLLGEVSVQQVSTSSGPSKTVVQGLLQAEAALHGDNPASTTGHTDAPVSGRYSGLGQSIPPTVLPTLWTDIGAASVDS